ncbi:MAG: hypothetical protein QG567_819 [Campylobacterota bacterium]|nr:hypothetical protein [Campylobacterota bacterium]
MTISSVVDIVNGKLLNKPSINRVENIKINAKKVKRGDLFISFFDDDIDTALKNGAYGVVAKDPKNTNDNEVAWICVDDVNKSALFLLRYLLLERNIEFYYFKEPLFSLSKQLIKKDQQLLFLEDSIYHWFEDITQNENIKTCISNNVYLLEALSSNPKEISCDNKSSVLKESLFEMSLFCNEKQYNLKISSRLKDYACAIIGFSEKNQLQLNAEAQMEDSIFKTHYLNSNAEITQKPSKRVVIFDFLVSSEYHKESIEYLQKHYKWAKILFIDGCKNEEELKEILKKSKFDIALVATKASFSLDYFSESSPKDNQLSLF